MIVVDAVIPMRRRAVDLERRLVEVGLVRPLAAAVREIGRRAPEIAVDSHRAIAMVTVIRAFRRVDRDQMMVDAEAIARRVTIGEQPCLQHLVG